MSFNYEEVREESRQHSRNTSDWTNEALIKEVLWAEYSYEKSALQGEEYITASQCDRCTNALCELVRRIKSISVDYDTFDNYMDIVHNLLEAQNKMAESLCSSNTKRNFYLRKIEDIFNSVKDPKDRPLFISDILIP